MPSPLYSWLLSKKISGRIAEGDRLFRHDVFPVSTFHVFRVRTYARYEVAVSISREESMIVQGY